jgi:hypothetical protein
VVGVGVRQQHVAHVLGPHPGGAQVAQHLAQAWAEAGGGAGIDQHQPVGRAHQIGVDRRLHALGRLRHVAGAQPAFGLPQVDAFHLRGGQKGHAVEQRGDLQTADHLAIDTRHLNEIVGRAGLGVGARGQQQCGGQCGGAP